jgi:hypothetical protein
MVTACHRRTRIEYSAVSARTTKDMPRGTRDTKLSAGDCSQSATMELRRKGGAKLSNSSQAQTTEGEEAVAETSRKAETESVVLAKSNRSIKPATATRASVPDSRQLVLALVVWSNRVHRLLAGVEKSPGSSVSTTRSQIGRSLPAGTRRPNRVR